MTMLTLWNDWRWTDHDRALADLDTLRREMNRVFDQDFARERAPSARWPRYGLFDRGAELEVRAELPGLADKDLNVTLEPSLLTLRGKRAVPAPEGYTAHRQERAGYEFARSFTLPCKVDPEKASATLRDGVLTLRVAKAAEERPRQIQVRS
jgi:HSP20 family protein